MAVSKRGRHGWYVLGGVPYSAHFGFPGKDAAGNDVFATTMICHGSNWAAFGPFKNCSAACRWFHKNCVEGKPMRFDPWYVVKRYVRDGDRPFSPGEVLAAEDGNLEFTDHRRRLRRPRKYRDRGLFHCGGPLPPAVTRRTRLPKRSKIGMRFVRPRP